MNIEENMPVLQASQEATRHSFPENYLIKVFQDALNDKRDIKVSSRKLGKIILLGTRRKYSTDSKEEESLFCLPAEDLSITFPTTEDLLSASRVGRDATELLWNAAFYLSSGQLLEGYHLHDVVQLVSWPNLTRLPITPNTFRILSLFSRRPTSVYFAARLLKIPLTEMIQVYSASRVAGHIKAINGTSEEHFIPPHRNRTFLSSLLKKIVGR